VNFVIEEEEEDEEEDGIGYYFTPADTETY
jgi:hypothetical protein